ncbi:hypothetical protein KB221_01730 [Aquidulcibacter paucihalophilus]|nr:hypothetical protein KB221_01730 [Aquidulcibacter paucihalophilus]
MALEAGLVAEQIDVPAPADRRARAERRGPDRRSNGSRINPQAPRRSVLKLLGALGVGISTALLVITLLAVEILGARAAMSVLAFEVALLFISTLWLALGSIELRLVEIRLELMMLNGGMRSSDRRGSSRRSGRGEA